MADLVADGALGALDSADDIEEAAIPSRGGGGCGVVGGGDGGRGEPPGEVVHLHGGRGRRLIDWSRRQVSPSKASMGVLATPMTHTSLGSGPPSGAQVLGAVPWPGGGLSWLLDLTPLCAGAHRRRVDWVDGRGEREREGR